MAEQLGIFIIYSNANPVSTKVGSEDFFGFNTEHAKKMGEAAVLAKSCDYLGAGTVEFFIGRK
jgi:hypothetical protein